MFGPRLRELRIARGIKQTELAASAGIRAHTLWRYENGQNTPSARVLQKLAFALGVSIEDLLADDSLNQMSS